MTSMLGGGESGTAKEEEAGDVDVIQMVSNMFSTMDTNDLESLKAYLDSNESRLDDYTNAVEYSYAVAPGYTRKMTGESDRSIRTGPLTPWGWITSGSNTMMSSMMSTDMFYEMPENTSLYEGQYDVKAGRWPKNEHECVVVLMSNGSE